MFQLRFSRYESDWLFTKQQKQHCINLFSHNLPYMGVWSLAGKQVCFGLVKWATCTDFVAKKNSYSLLSATDFFATDNNLNCWQTGLNLASKVRNIAIQPTLQQCCKTSRRFFSVCRFTIAYKISSVPIRCKPLWYLRSDRCMHGNYYGMFRIVHGTLNWALTACCCIRPKGNRERANDSVHYSERGKH